MNNTPPTRLIIFFLFTILSCCCWGAGFDPVLIACMVNMYRYETGLQPLGINNVLQEVAQGHSNFQAYTHTMSHTGYGASTPGQRVSSFGINWYYVGENVAFGYEDEYEVMYGWMTSPGHRANILSRDFRMMGNAIAFSSDRTPYYTQVFATDRNSAYYIPSCGNFNLRGFSEVKPAKSGSITVVDPNHPTGFSSVKFVNAEFVNSTESSAPSPGTPSRAASVHASSTTPPPAGTTPPAPAPASIGGDVFGVPHAGTPSNSAATPATVEVFGVPHAQASTLSPSTIPSTPTTTPGTINQNAGGSMNAASVNNLPNAAKAASPNVIGLASPAPAAASSTLHPVPLGNGKMITFPGFQVSPPPSVIAAASNTQVRPQLMTPQVAQPAQPQMQAQPMLQQQSQQQKDIEMISGIMELLPFGPVLLKLGVADDGITPTLLVSTYEEEQQ